MTTGSNCNVLQVLRYHDKLLRRDGFLRWRRRSKWPLGMLTYSASFLCGLFSTRVRYIDHCHTLACGGCTTCFLFYNTTTRMFIPYTVAVRTKRAHWLYHEVLIGLQQYASQVTTQKECSNAARLSFLSRRWPDLKQRVRAHKRSRLRLTMAVSLWDLQRITSALHTLRAWSSQRLKVYNAVTTALQRTRRKKLHAAVLRWRCYSIGVLQRSENMYGAGLLWKRRCLMRFRRGIELLASSATEAIAADSQQSTQAPGSLAPQHVQIVGQHAPGARTIAGTPQSTTQALTGRSPTKGSKARWVLFRGRLYRRRHALVRLWKHSVRIAMQQRDAVIWGVKW
jgi:hypothetical protein